MPSARARRATRSWLAVAIRGALLGPNAKLQRGSPNLAQDVESWALWLEGSPWPGPGGQSRPLFSFSSFGARLPVSVRRSLALFTLPWTRSRVKGSSRKARGAHLERRGAFCCSAASSPPPSRETRLSLSEGGRAPRSECEPRATTMFFFLQPRPSNLSPFSTHLKHHRGNKLKLETRQLHSSTSRHVRCRAIRCKRGASARA